MATLNLGRIKPVFRGAYAVGTAYVVDDIVTSGNETFICILASTGNATSNATYWTKLAAKGTDGTDGTDLTSTLTTQGDIVYRDGSGLQRLAKPASTMNLQMTSGGVPSWIAPAIGTFKSVHYKKSTDHWSMTCSDTGTAITDGTVAFNIVVTPESSSSKFIIGASFSHAQGGQGGGLMGYFLVERAISGGSTTDLVGDVSGSRYRGTHGVGHANAAQHTGPSFQTFDAPATTSAITYTLQFGTHSATNTCYFGGFNSAGSGSAVGWDNVGICQMWVFEYA